MSIFTFCYCFIAPLLSEERHYIYTAGTAKVSFFPERMKGLDERKHILHNIKQYVLYDIMCFAILSLFFYKSMK